MLKIKDAPPLLREVLTELDSPHNGRGNFQLFADATAYEIATKLNDDCKLNDILQNPETLKYLESLGVVARDGKFYSDCSLERNAFSTYVSQFTESFVNTIRLRDPVGYLREAFPDNPCILYKDLSYGCDSGYLQGIVAVTGDLLSFFDIKPPIAIVDRSGRLNNMKTIGAAFALWAIFVDEYFTSEDSTMVATMVAHELGHNLTNIDSPFFNMNEVQCEYECESMRYEHYREYEADKIGIILLYLNGYNPNLFVLMLQYLQKSEELELAIDGGFTSANPHHPPTEDRIFHSKKFIAELLGFAE